MQRELREASGGLAVARIRSMQDVIRHSTVRSDFTALLLTSFAAGSLLLAAVGIYGLIVFSVEQRQHEIGVRMALGATSEQVLHLVARQGMLFTLAGVAAGAMASVGLARFMTRLLYGVKPVDPWTIGAACIVLFGVAAGASYIPAHRASRMDPASVLRSI
jgi:ABC-type antimicrobial peptide transport system permease subunit